MRLRSGPKVAVAALLMVILAPVPAGSISGPPRQAEIIGHSVQYRRLRLVRIGDPAAPRKVLVVGCIHGTETAGMAVTRALRHAYPPDGTQLLVLDTVNPDGCLAGTRGNAHGVDLNRNFPWGWRPLGGVFYSGARSSSEPETRAVEALILRERPDVSIWFHQHLDWVDLQRGSSTSLMTRYARVTGMRSVQTPVLPGTVARWENHRLPGRSAFVVELPAGSLSAAGAAAQARAVLAVARLARPRSGSTSSAEGAWRAMSGCSQSRHRIASAARCNGHPAGSTHRPPASPPSPTPPGRSDWRCPLAACQATRTVAWQRPRVSRPRTEATPGGR